MYKKALVSLHGHERFNKNWILMSIWRQLTTEKIYKSVEHSFLIPGHNHLPFDRDLTFIEIKEKKIHEKCGYTMGRTYTQRQIKNPFKVTLMESSDFKILKETISSSKKLANLGEI